MLDWLLKNGKLDQELVDIGLKDGRIVALEPARGALQNAKAEQLRDLKKNVILPGLIDVHTHLDKTFATLENNSGTLGEALTVWRRVRAARSPGEIARSATRAVKLAIANGVTAMRSHIDIYGPDELIEVEVLLDLREAYRDQIDLQFVGLGTSSGDQRWLDGLRTALKMGVDFVGGCPALQPDPQAEIDAVFALAEETGKPIDLHVDETEDPHMLSLRMLAQTTIERGMQGGVTAGHCCSLTFVGEEEAKETIDLVAQAGIHIVTLPSCNLVLMGRKMAPTPRGTTRVKQLLAAGVNVCAASDNVHDPFNPFGSYDLLQIANLNAHVAHMSGADERQESLNMVTSRAAACLNLDEYGIKVGNRADLVVLNTSDPTDLILAPPDRLMTFKNGVLLVENIIKESWYI